MIRRVLGLAGAFLIAAAVILCVLSAVHAVPDAPSFSAASRSLPAPDPQPIARPDGTVDVNSDDPEDLTALKGVGETIAGRIIDERRANGPYYYPEDLLAVRGIGAATLGRIRDELDYSLPEAP